MARAAAPPAAETRAAVTRAAVTRAVVVSNAAATGEGYCGEGRGGDGGKGGGAEGGGVGDEGGDDKGGGGEGGCAEGGSSEGGSGVPHSVCIESVAIMPLLIMWLRLSGLDLPCVGGPLRRCTALPHQLRLQQQALLPPQPLACKPKPLSQARPATRQLQSLSTCTCNADSSSGQCNRLQMHLFIGLPERRRRSAIYEKTDRSTHSGRRVPTHRVRFLS